MQRREFLAVLSASAATVAANRAVRAQTSAVDSQLPNGMTEIQDNVDWPAFLARHDLVWQADAPPRDWRQSAFLGNGLLGAMAYVRDEANAGARTLGFDIGRSDVHEHCRDRTPMNGKHRLPIGRLTLRTVGQIQSAPMRLHLWDAQASGTLETDRGRIEWRAFVPSDDLAIVIALQTTEGERDCRFEWEAHAAISTRHKYHPGYKHAERPVDNPPSFTEQNGEVSVCVQTLTNGGEYATAWRETNDNAGGRAVPRATH